MTFSVRLNTGIPGLLVDPMGVLVGTPIDPFDCRVEDPMFCKIVALRLVLYGLTTLPWDARKKLCQLPSFRIYLSVHR